MRPLILKMSLSADAFVAGPNGELAWLFESSTDDSRAWVLDTLVGAGAHLMGSRTYQDMAAYWPYSDIPMAAPMNAAPKVVFTRNTHPMAPGTEPTTQAILDANKATGVGTKKADPKVLESWRSPRFMRGDLVAHARALKAEAGGPLLAHGGASFARSLIAADLVDEYRLVCHPVILGKGMPIFTDAKSQKNLELISSTAFKGGVVANVYRPKR